MTSKTISNCTDCRHLVDCDAYNLVAIYDHKEESNACAPIIDAEKSNEALKMVSRIRERTGSDLMELTPEGKLLYQRK
jgi:hypothetical protein